MIIVLIIYSISWLILLISYMIAGYRKGELSTDKKSDYLYAAILFLAPLTVLLFLYYLISSYISEMKETKATRKQEKEESEEKSDIQSSVEELNAAKRKPQENHSFVHAMTAQALVEKIKKKDYDSFMRYLSHLSLPSGVSLHVKECTDNGLGDESKIYVKTPENKYELNIWDYIKVENSIDGVWDAYFLYIVWHLLPLWWHANYNKRTYLFSKEDADEIQFFSGKEEELAEIKEAIKPLICGPEVTEVIKGYYYVRCCYWTNFGGLIKEKVRVRISNEGRVYFFVDEELTLYQYDCGIMF